MKHSCFLIHSNSIKYNLYFKITYISSYYKQCNTNSNNTVNNHTHSKITVSHLSPKLLWSIIKPPATALNAKKEIWSKESIGVSGHALFACAAHVVCAADAPGTQKSHACLADTLFSSEVDVWINIAHSLLSMLFGNVIWYRWLYKN